MQRFKFEIIDSRIVALIDGWHRLIDTGLLATMGSVAMVIGERLINLRFGVMPKQMGNSLMSAGVSAIRYFPKIVIDYPPRILHLYQ